MAFFAIRSGIFETHFCVFALVVRVLVGIGIGVVCLFFFHKTLRFFFSFLIRLLAHIYIFCTYDTEEGDRYHITL